MLSLRLGAEDRARLRELVDRLGTNPSDAVRQLLRAAIPEVPDPRMPCRRGDPRQLELPCRRRDADPRDPADRGIHGRSE